MTPTADQINPIHLMNHQIIQDLPFGVIVVDSEWKIGDWNAWMVRISGVPRSEAQGKALADLFPDLADRGLVDKIKSVFDTERVTRVPYQEVPDFLHFDHGNAPEASHDIIQETELRPLLDFEGEVAAVCVITRDVTDHVARLSEVENLNARLGEVNSELEEANQVKSSFLDSVSHELRTPLSAVLGFVEILEDGLAESPEEEKEFLKNIRESATHLMEQINDILDIAKIQAGKLEFELQPVNLLEMLSEVQAHYHPRGKKKGVEINLEMEDFELEVLAESDRLRQVLNNVLGNALRLTDEGSITIKSFLSEETPEIVKIEVVDTGIGIAPNELDLVFEEFRKVNNSSECDYGGTGLGMSLAISLMKLMNGTIEVSSPGLRNGSTFTFRLPVAARA